MDDDFLAITREWQKAGQSFAGLVFAEQLNCSIGEAIRDLELIAKALEPADMLNHIEFIPF